MDRKEMPSRTCSSCRAPMRPVSAIPKFGHHPELVTFRCTQCGHVETIEQPLD